MPEDGGSGRSLADKIKNPFQNMKQNLEESLDNNQHLRDAKIHLSHKKYVPMGGGEEVLGGYHATGPAG